MENVISVKNITKSFYNELGKIDVLNNINFDLKKGEIISIVGPSGSGKTTIFNLISNLIKPDYGEILINGKLGYMFQNDHLLKWKDVYKNIILGLEINKRNINDFTKKIDLLLEKYGLLDFKRAYPNELSGGMKQRIALIRTLIVEPNILLLDEPFSALDYQTRLNICDDIYEIIKERNLSAILITHDIAEAISFSDRILVLSKRPASINSVYEINLCSNINRTPFKSRTCIEFQDYFDSIWCDLNE